MHQSIIQWLNTYSNYKVWILYQCTRRSPKSSNLYYSSKIVWCLIFSCGDCIQSGIEQSIWKMNIQMFPLTTQGSRQNCIMCWNEFFLMETLQINLYIFSTLHYTFYSCWNKTSLKKWSKCHHNFNSLSHPTNYHVMFLLSLDFSFSNSQM